MLSAGLCHKSAHSRRSCGLQREHVVKFASTRLIVGDIKAVVSFYEIVTGQAAEWLAPVFAEIVTPNATLALGSAETVAAFKEGIAEPAANRTAILALLWRFAERDRAFADSTPGCVGGEGSRWTWMRTGVSTWIAGWSHF